MSLTLSPIRITRKRSVHWSRPEAAGSAVQPSTLRQTMVMLHSVSAIIVTHNRAQDLARTLEHIRRDGLGISELIVVDNASSDGTRELVSNEFPGVKLVRLHKNTGVSFARNVGAVNASGEFLLYLDDDCFVDFAAVWGAVNRMAGDDRLAAIGFNVVNLPLEDALTVYESRRFDQYKTGEWADAAEFSGGACLLRRSVFLEVGGYNDRLFYLVEETDFSLRLLAKGYEIRRSGDVICLHYASPSSRPSKRRVFYHYRNWVIVNAKYYPVPFFLLETLGLIAIGLGRSIRDRQFIPYVKGALSGIATVLSFQVGRQPLTYHVFLQYYRRRLRKRRDMIARVMLLALGDPLTGRR